MSDLQVQENIKEDEKAEQEVVEKVDKKLKSKTTGNLIADIAAEIEVLQKAKALSLATSLSENIETNFFKLGGVLKVIHDNDWFDGFPDWETFVFEKFGLQKRKAYYLTQIYTDLVGKQIPWEKVAHLGWTKLKELSPILTLENLDTWVEKANGLTVIELLKLLKADSQGSDGSCEKVTDEIVKLGPFKLKEDQASTVHHALSKAKGELGTDYDTVALENICSLYLSGNMGQIASVDAKTVIKSIGWEETLNIFGELYPNVDITIDVK